MIMEQLKEETPKKAMLTANETCNYLGIAKSYLYKLTHRKAIPHYKPFGKLIYFKLSEVDEWLERNRISTEEELNEQANKYLMGKGGAK